MFLIDKYCDNNHRLSIIIIVIIVIVVVIVVVVVVIVVVVIDRLTVQICYRPRRYTERERIVGTIVRKYYITNSVRGFPGIRGGKI